MKTELKIEYQVCDNKTNAVPVIIVAAGSSTRMQGKNKQTLCIGEIPVIARTLMAFENSDYISRIILVVRTEDIFSMQVLAEKYGISKVSDIVCGGDSRQESVLKGFSRIAEDEQNVLIHDGARPFIDNTIIKDVVCGLQNFSAVICGVKVKDTIKEINDDGIVISTPKRETLLSVQTPQGVRVKDYLGAVEKIGDVSSFTDDASLMEAVGYKVFCTEGSYKNIKITTPEDILTAESFIKEEGL